MKQRKTRKIEMKKSHLVIIVCLALMLIAGFSIYNRGRIFSVQNCYGGTVEIIIEFGKGQSKIPPEVAELLDENQIRFFLEYPKTKKIFRTSKRLKAGLPLKKMIIIRSDTTILNYGDEILPMMDTDLIGGPTHTICI